MSTNKICFFVILVILSGCLRDEFVNNLNMDSAQSKLVVYGLLSPEKDPFVNVRMTKGFDEPNGKTDDLAHGAEVILINELGEAITLLEDDTITGNYYVDNTQFAIEKGKSYQLEVNYEELSVTAKCSVPHEEAVWNDFKHAKIAEEDEIFIGAGAYKTNSVSSYWLDVSNENNTYFYTTGATYEFIVQDSIIGIDSIYTYAPDSMLNFESRYFFNPYDYTAIGDSIFFNSEIGYYGRQKGYFYLITSDENFFQFMVTAGKMQEFIDPNLVNFIISYKGILPEFTNIEGGVGFFGAYLTDSVYFEME